MDSQASQLLRVIDFAFAERNYSKAITAIDSSKGRIEPSKQLWLKRAQANIELSNAAQCLKDLKQAAGLGSPIQEHGLMKIRAYLELQQPEEAELAIKEYVRNQPEKQTLLAYSNAVQILKDKFDVYKLSMHQQDLFSRMQQKLTDAGAQIAKLKVVNLEKGYRGVIATKKINKKTPIVYVPKSEIITLELAKLNRFSKKVIMKDVRLLSPKHTFLSIFLLEERVNLQSKWRLYIDSLPEDLSCFPINYSPEELEMLEGSPFLYMIHEKVIDLKKDYITVMQCDPQFAKYSFKDFCWARTMVGSRIFGVSMNGVKTEILVPFADMLNHRLPKQTAWNYSNEMNGFVIESIQEVEIGNEVFDSYGRKCNFRFLLNYGFVLPNNADNEIVLRVVIDEQTPMFEEKLVMLKVPITTNHIHILKSSRNLNSGKFFELMGYLRFVNVEKQENLDVLMKISKISQTRQAYRPTRTPPISIPNETKAWQSFLQLCRECLAQYKTSLEKDKELYAAAGDQNTKNILMLRIGEKEILRDFIHVGQQIIMILTSEDIIGQLQKNTDKHYFRYMVKILGLTPGINKQELQKRMGIALNSGSDAEEDKEEGDESCIQNEN